MATTKNLFYFKWLLSNYLISSLWPTFFRVFVLKIGEKVGHKFLIRWRLNRSSFVVAFRPSPFFSRGRLGGGRVLPQGWPQDLGIEMVKTVWPLKLVDPKSPFASAKRAWLFKG
jgi:hypothetical protein